MGTRGQGKTRRESPQQQEKLRGGTRRPSGNTAAEAHWCSNSKEERDKHRTELIVGERTAKTEVRDELH